MKSDHSMHGKLLDIFKAYASADEADAAVDRDTVFEKMRTALVMNRQEFIDGFSFYHRNVLSRRIASESLAVTADGLLSWDAVADIIARQLQNVYPPERIRAFVAGLFSERAMSVESPDSVSALQQEKGCLPYLAGTTGNSTVPSGMSFAAWPIICSRTTTLCVTNTNPPIR